MIKKRKLKSAVVDTNIFVSGLILEKGFPFQLVQKLRSDSFTLVLSSELRQELEEVIMRSKFSAFLSEEQIDIFLLMIDTISKFVEPISLPMKIRDPKDEKVLAAALASGVDYLITGDEDLLTLKGDSRLGKLKIVTVKEFLRKV